MSEPSIEYLTSAEVDRALDGIDVVASAAEVLRLHAGGSVLTPAKAYLQWPVGAGAARSLNMPSWVRTPQGTLVGTKVINGNPANPNRGLPRADAVILLFDPETGQIRTMMPGARISALRTAAVTATAVQRLAARPPRTLALIGTGAQAQAHLHVLVPLLPELSEVLLHDHEDGRAREFAHHCATTYAGRNLTFRVVADPRSAVTPADVVATLTTTTEGYLRHDWLKPGCVLVNVSLDDPLPEVFLRADALVVDEWGLITADRRRILGKLHRAGRIAARGTPDCPDRGEGRAVTAHLGEVVSGTVKVRATDDDIVLVNPIGMSAQDIALAAEVAGRARRLGLGRSLAR